MLSAVANVFLNIFSRWADRSVVIIRVKRLEYNMIRNDPYDIVVFINPYPSRYYAEVEFSHRGKAITIKELKLIIDNNLKLDAPEFSPLKLEHGDYHETIMIFPVQENQAIKEGTFEIRAVDGFNKVYQCKGQFPTQTQT